MFGENEDQNLKGEMPKSVKQSSHTNSFEST